MTGSLTWATAWLSIALGGLAADSLPPVDPSAPPRSLDELWAGYDPRKEPLEEETTLEWEQDGVICRVVRYRIGSFKGIPATMAGFYAFPKDRTGLPGLLQIHGGGQSASLEAALADAKGGYACLSINWGGNPLAFGRTPRTYDGPNTDWGRLDGTHPPQRNPINHFIGGQLAPDDFTLDPVESARNSNWFLVLIAARRGITFLQHQPEVDAGRIGVYGHSMGGKLTTDLAAIDPRVRVAVPSCGGAGTVLSRQTDLPGCVKTDPTPIELACVSDNPYIERLACQLLWLSPTNDFHAPIDNMAVTWRSIPDDRLRLSIAPHLNHLHTDSHWITQRLFFDQHLKAGLAIPASPVIEIRLDASDGIPRVRVTPDRSLPVKKVDIYYSLDPQVLTRFWRDAGAVEGDGVWQATCPIMQSGEPIFAFANVTYDLPEAYHAIATPPGHLTTDRFTISSRPVLMSAGSLEAAGVKATDKPDAMIDDGSREWHDWYRSNWDHPPLWRAFTRKLKDPKWRGHDGAKLSFDIRCQGDNQLVVEFETNGWGAFDRSRPAVSFNTVVPLIGSPDWQTVTVTLDELVSTDPKVSTPLTTWQTVTLMGIGPSGEVVRDGKKTPVASKPWIGPRAIRNLRWR